MKRKATGVVANQIGEVNIDSILDIVGQTVAAVRQNSQDIAVLTTSMTQIANVLDHVLAPQIQAEDHVKLKDIDDDLEGMGNRITEIETKLKIYIAIAALIGPVVIGIGAKALHII